MSYTFTHELTLVTETCCACGVVFAMPDWFQRQLKKTGETFYCPSGHGQHYRDNLRAENDRLKKEIEQERERKTLIAGWYDAERRDHEHTRKRLAATKGVVTRTKKRLANGVCPCCNRHFVNLERHMKGQHPDYQVTGEEE